MPSNVRQEVVTAENIEEIQRRVSYSLRIGDTVQIPIPASFTRYSLDMEIRPTPPQWSDFQAGPAAQNQQAGVQNQRQYYSPRAWDDSSSVQIQRAVEARGLGRRPTERPKLPRNKIEPLPLP